MTSKKKSPLISVIMNCHNGEKYLKESLKSVKSQTFKNWELIFYDNNSSDNSKIEFKKFNEKRFKYFSSKKFLALYDARNKAIEKSKGKYLAFLDVDDIWTKDKLQKQVLLIKKSYFQMVYSNYKILYQKDKSKIIKYNKKLPSGNITQELLKEYCINISTLLVEKKILLKNKFNRLYSIIGDFAFNIHISKSIRIGCIQKPLIFYRLHNNNFSRKNIDLYFSEMRMWYNSDGKKLKNEGFNLYNIKILILKLLLKKILSRLI